MKTLKSNSPEGIVITEIDFIPVDDSYYGKARKAIVKKTMIDFYSLVELAKKSGLELPDEAFIHNYEAWRNDYKSNYHYNGVNCYTPCRCNELSFTLSIGNGETFTA